MTFEQAADSFGWGELINFSRHLPSNSATYRAMHEDAAKFASDLQEAAILADIYDAVSMFAYSFAKSRGYRGQKPRPYQRPWSTGDIEEKHFGKDPIPISEFYEWYYGGDDQWPKA